MTEQRDCRQCRGSGRDCNNNYCLNCGGRGWTNEYVRESSGSESKPLFYNTLVTIGLISGFVIGGYIGLSSGIEAAIIWAVALSIVFAICAAIFSFLLRFLIIVSIIIGVLVWVNRVCDKVNEKAAKEKLENLRNK